MFLRSFLFSWRLRKRVFASEASPGSGPFISRKTNPALCTTPHHAAPHQFVTLTSYSSPPCTHRLSHHHHLHQVTAISATPISVVVMRPWHSLFVVRKKGFGYFRILWIFLEGEMKSVHVFSGREIFDQRSTCVSIAFAIFMIIRATLQQDACGQRSSLAAEILGERYYHESYYC